jgi:hypothetical protein
MLKGGNPLSKNLNPRILCSYVLNLLCNCLSDEVILDCNLVCHSSPLHGKNIFINSKMNVC